MSWASSDADGEVGFETGLIETGEGTPGTGGLKVSGRQGPRENQFTGQLGVRELDREVGRERE